MQPSLRAIDRVWSSHYAAAEMEPREVGPLFKVTYMINFGALVFSAKIGLARSIDGHACVLLSND